MADGADIHIDAERAERLKAAAHVAGLSTEAYALKALDRAMDDDWAEALASLEEFDRTGESVAAEDALETFRKNVEQRIAKRP
jgi:UDP:flavonoid glycosyltransferase YjiC (YdhE family)